ncbi:MAG: hypothetical protein HN337_07810 [Deltaproteobacteria bacterium]|jgi:hypothetical protein|nr:hypothetical protein [Deltaproteobacteria bacterium]
MTPHQLAHELERIYGEQLKSVVLYGSAASNNYSKKFSDFNIFCVIDEPSPGALSKSNTIVRKWVKKGNPPPHFFDTKHIETSLDVFPMEFMDIKDQHKVLLGKDPLEGISVDPKNLRHQCESELKGKLLHLRAFYAENCNKPKLISEIMVKSFPTFLATFRGALRLLGKKPPREAKATVELISAEVDINTEIFLQIIESRTGESLMPRGDEALEMFERYITELTVITDFVDRMQF